MDGLGAVDVVVLPVVVLLEVLPPVVVGLEVVGLEVEGLEVGGGGEPDAFAAFSLNAAAVWLLEGLMARIAP